MSNAQTMSTSSPSSSSATNPNSPDICLELTRALEECKVCAKPAFCYNYGVLTCNACKMFFRRVKVEKITYVCKFRNYCYDKNDKKGNSLAFRCKSCRFQRCLEVGMVYIPPGKPLVFEVQNQKDNDFQQLIDDLVFMDSRRRHKILNFYTDENPTLQEMIERSRGSTMIMKTANHKVNVHEWSFFGIYTAVELFMGLTFMNSINSTDKINLLKFFAMKASLFSSAMRTAEMKSDRIMSPDGNDVYPDALYQLGKFSMEFLNRIRSLLVSRILELKITTEEHILLTVLLFCNPALPNLSDHARSILTAQQSVYNSALFQYCQLKYQKSGPSRFTDLLSLCHVMNRNHEDVHNLSILFQFYIPGVKYKKLFLDVFSNMKNNE